MECNYPRAYKEVIEILKYVPEESVNKIPQIKLDIFNFKKDDTYDFHVDENKSFEEQELLEETKAILANIFRDYWATPYQKERIIEKEKYDREKEKKTINYNNDLFKRKDRINTTIEKQNTNNYPVEVKKESFFEKIIKILKRRSKRK